MVKNPTPGEVLSAYFTAIGRKGGLASAKTKTKAERVASARRAVLARWAKQKQKKESD
jgi:hypothetical protein